MQAREIATIETEQQSFAATLHSVAGIEATKSLPTASNFSNGANIPHFGCSLG
jgi:hypothetical protein